MLLYVIDDYSCWIYVGVFKSIDDEFSAFQFILKMGSVNEDGEIIFFGDLDMLFEDC